MHKFLRNAFGIIQSSSNHPMIVYFLTSSAVSCFFIHKFYSFISTTISSNISQYSSKRVNVVYIYIIYI